MVFRFLRTLFLSFYFFPRLLISWRFQTFLSFCPSRTFLAFCLFRTPLTFYLSQTYLAFCLFRTSLSFCLSQPFLAFFPSRTFLAFCLFQTFLSFYCFPPLLSFARKRLASFSLSHRYSGLGRNVSFQTLYPVSSRFLPAPQAADPGKVSFSRPTDRFRQKSLFPAPVLTSPVLWFFHSYNIPLFYLTGVSLFLFIFIHMIRSHHTSTVYGILSINPGYFLPALPCFPAFYPETKFAHSLILCLFSKYMLYN